ncbi:MAG TPA: flavodoxin family protein [Candidatus Eisenbergiella merdipullorum]|uniref:Flavodoxin family protein n=1 Tax=Candidatus Eisenbergiella merdipullorum TaxID=2838553 RepID=A0A9D2I4N8_9FIRM|nr:flavodoxin family protein [Candidatus Eisenbergiella merdipullorum]
MKAMVAYSSRTGNTKKVANGIFAGIPGESKDMQSLEEYAGKDADIFFVGFWTDKGTCDMSVVDFLSGLHGKKVALFGTCGMGNDSSYMAAIEHRVKVWIPEDCTYLGAFMCQGKMPMDVRRRYESMEKNGVEPEKVKMLLKNFDEALLHPDDKDVQNAAAFAVRMMEKAQRR